VNVRIQSRAFNQISLYGSFTPIDNEPITGSLGLSIVGNGDFKTIPIYSTAINGPGSIFITLDPVQAYLIFPHISSYNVVVNITSSNSTWNMTMDLFTIDTYVNLTQIMVDYVTVCTGLRFLTLDIPDDGFGHNITMIAYSALSPSYSTVFVRSGVPPDPSLPSDGGVYMDTETIDKTTSAGFSFKNLLPPGRYYMALACEALNQQINFPVQYSIQTSTTCPLGCFEKGECLTDNFFVPYCVCDFWHIGFDCGTLFPGVYALLVVAAAIFIIFVICCTIRIQYWLKPVAHHDDIEDERERKAVSMMDPRKKPIGGIQNNEKSSLLKAEIIDD